MKNRLFPFEDRFELSYNSIISSRRILNFLGLHPCFRLTVSTAKPVADFHRQVITRAEHTKNRAVGFIAQTDCYKARRKSRFY